MKFQLLMIIAVIVSSLMTISQRAYAHDTNKFRWLEPTIEQRCDESVAPDQNNGSDSGCIALSNLNLNVSELKQIGFLLYKVPAFAPISRNLIPRAPPVLMI